MDQSTSLRIRKPRVVGASLALLLIAAAGVAGQGEVPARRYELVRLVRHDCGSCHGLTLRGGLGPALTPEALADKPDDSLVATILFGRPGTPMPPWRPFLDEAEARWVVSALKKGFPDVRSH